MPLFFFVCFPFFFFLQQYGARLILGLRRVKDIAESLAADKGESECVIKDSHGIDPLSALTLSPRPTDLVEKKNRIFFATYWVVCARVHVCEGLLINKINRALPCNRISVQTHNCILERITAN
jgi:hypothetical protein